MQKLILTLMVSIIFSAAGCGSTESSEKKDASKVSVDNIEKQGPIYPIEQKAPQLDPQPEPGSKLVGSLSRFEKLLAVLGEFGIEDERSFKQLVAPFHNHSTRREFEERLIFIDPQNELQRYATWNDESLTLYRDRDSKKIKDFSIKFLSENSAATDRPRTDLQVRLTEIANNPNELPLKGLRVAIDAGHMHSGNWDRITGKFVEMNGKFVSEGFLTFHTATALARELRALGAETLMIRDSADAVTTTAFETFDISTSADAEFLAASDRTWFDLLLSSFEVGPQLPQLIDAFISSEGRTKIYNETKRVSYFTHRVDLSARVEKALNFKPDLTVIIHYDAWSWGQNPPNFNETRTYVMGNVMPSEAASREDRALILRELLNPVRWNESVALSQAMVSALSQQVGVPIKNSPTDFGSIKIVDGVYARNLGLTRRIYEGLLTYFECMMYENPEEFELMSQTDSAFGAYPSRVDAVAAGLTNGILKYFKKERPDTTSTP